MAIFLGLNWESYILDGSIYIHNYVTRILHMIFTGDVRKLIQNMDVPLIIPLLAGFIIASIV